MDAKVKLNDIETTTVYFAKPGKDNTEKTLALARKRAEELGIRTVLVATTDGDTAAKAARTFAGFQVVAVSHSHGFKKENASGITAENRSAIESSGIALLTTTHAFGGVNRAIRSTLETYTPVEIVSHTLRRVLGDGIKVVCEIAVMAADAGLVRTDEDVVSIAGTGHGADTAVVIKPANAHNFFDLRIKELICKPR
ncbi:MAG: pyruvate kinase alpha/beta domain-containing protein [Dehalococcoidia bacterium]|nr:pyruvate kinase alpha/beta domain-containing protein [Dehalococcoidia bacterium]